MSSSQDVGFFFFWSWGEQQKDVSPLKQVPQEVCYCVGRVGRAVSIAVVCQEISAVLAVLLLTVWPSCVKRSLLLFFCSFGCRYMQMYTGVARVVRAVSSRVVKISASFFFVLLVNIVQIFL